MTTDDKIREAFDTAQVDPKCASFNLDSFSFHLGYKAALSSLQFVGEFESEYMGGPVIFYQVNLGQGGEPLYRIAPTKEGES